MLFRSRDTIKLIINDDSLDHGFNSFDLVLEKYGFENVEILLDNFRNSLTNIFENKFDDLSMDLHDLLVFVMCFFAA